MGETELVVNARELQWISVRCPTCNTSVTFDATASSPPGNVLCPGCNRTIEGLNHIVSHYRLFFQQLRDPLVVQFRVPLKGQP